MIDISTPKGRIVSAALRLAQERPWPDVTLRDIAEAGAIPLDSLRREFAGKSAILKAFVRGIDDDVLAKAPRRDPAESARDRLFEVVMARLDALKPHKEAVRSILKNGPSSPRDLATMLRSQVWMLHAAGISPDGPLGPARVAGLASTYAAVVRTWLEDDDPGLARTMAVLDRRLRSGERTLSTLEDIQKSFHRMGSLFRRGRASEPKGSGEGAGSPPAGGASQPAV